MRAEMLKSINGAHFLCKKTCTIRENPVHLQRVFLCIRFILRLVKIACRDDKQFFLRFAKFLGKA